jgi:hypothetical protein
MTAFMMISLDEPALAVAMKATFIDGDRLRLRCEEPGDIQVRLGRPVHPVLHDFRRRALPEQQIGHQRGNRDLTACIVAQVDDHLADALRLELRKGAAKLRIRRVDERAQVQVAHLLAAVVDDPGAVARGDRGDGELGFGDGGVAHRAVGVAHPQQPGRAGRIGPKGGENSIGAFGRDDHIDGLEVRGAGADGEDLGSPVHPAASAGASS